VSAERVVDRRLPATLLAGRVNLPPPLEQSRLAGLKVLRAEAVERVGALKLPTSHDEAWRFTGISALAEQSFHRPAAAAAVQRADIERFAIAEAAARLVFVDGIHVPELSRGADSRAGDGVVISNLAAVQSLGAAAVAAHLGRHAEFRDRLFAALNLAFLRDAAVVLVPRGTSLARPVHLLFVAAQPGAASHPRVLVVAEPGSEVSVIEDYVALHGEVGFTNPVAEIIVGAAAKVEHVRVQRESAGAFHLASCAVSLAAASRYRSVSIALGARVSRLDLSVQQTGEGAECTLDGLALIGGNQLADTHSVIDHLQPHGTSRQLHKCIVDGAAHAVFNGKVMVRPSAQKTDSAQSSRNLLLTPKAVVDTLPQLEIFADDVKCAHGATVGQLDAEEVFYLRSRGLSEAAAKNLLTYAFGAEVIDRIGIASLRRSLEQTVLERTERQP
jgi:Fe-S cluster assembly protein SufD